MPSVILDADLTALASAVWPGANVVRAATGTWYLYDTEWVELGRSTEEARAKLTELIAGAEKREPVRVMRGL